MIAIGTSGSTGYLEDSTGQRYWLVAVSRTVLNLCPIDVRRLWRDLRATGRVDAIACRFIIHREDEEQEAR